MTACVTITAHCTHKEKVIVQVITDTGKIIESKTLHDGESCKRDAYEDRHVVVTEIKKHGA